MNDECGRQNARRGDGRRGEGERGKLGFAIATGEGGRHDVVPLGGYGWRALSRIPRETGNIIRLLRDSWLRPASLPSDKSLGYSHARPAGRLGPGELERGSVTVTWGYLSGSFPALLGMVCRAAHKAACPAGARPVAELTVCPRSHVGRADRVTFCTKAPT